MTDTTTSASKNIQKLQRAIVDGLEDVKAQDIQVFDTEHITSLFERVIIASWVRLEPTKKRRLLVVTNRAYYMLREPLLQRCTVCDPHLFCPTGPEPLQRFAFREVHEIALGWGAQPGVCQRVQIMWSRHRVTLEKPAKELQFSLLPLHVADTIAKTIRNLNPLAHPAPMEVEAKTMRILREKLLEPATEEVRLYMQVD